LNGGADTVKLAYGLRILPRSSLFFSCWPVEKSNCYLQDQQWQQNIASYNPGLTLLNEGLQPRAPEVANRYVIYQRTIKHIFQYIIDGSLANAGQLLSEETEWFLCHMKELSKLLIFLSYPKANGFLLKGLIED
jgi:hypothetical protein